MRFALPIIALFSAAPAPAAPPAQCFAPQALMSVPGEEIVNQHTEKARVTAPKLERAAAALLASQRGVLREVRLPPGVKLVALTFDLCETGGEVAGYDGRIVDALRAANAPATFFAGGHWMATHTERTGQLMTDPLFEVASHSWAHLDPIGLEPAKLTREIEAPQAQFMKLARHLPEQCTAQEEAPALYRFPYGRCDPAAIKAVNDRGLIAVQWSVVSGDPAPAQSAAAIVRHVMAEVKPGSIIVMHANGHGVHTADAVPSLLAALKDKGYTPVTVSALMQAGTPVFEQSCYDRRPGDLNGPIGGFKLSKR